MKHNWKRLIAGLLTIVMLVGTLPPPALAALVDNTPDQNEAILAELTEFWGDEKTAQEAMELLRKYGLIDEDGNILTDWSGDIFLQEEVRPVTFAEVRTLNEGTVTVNGRACEVSDLNAALDRMENLNLFADGSPLADWQLAVDGQPVPPAGLDAALTAAATDPTGPVDVPPVDPDESVDPANATPESAQEQIEVHVTPVVTALGETADSDTLLEIISFLNQYGLLTDTGCTADWGLTLPGGERQTNVTELLAMLEDGDADRSMVITVDGASITLGDFETMMKIEAEIKRIRDTYLQDEVELTPEQAGSLYDLYQQLQENGIQLYDTRGADALVFPSGINHNATVSVSLDKSSVNGTDGGTVTATYTVSGAASNQEISFDVYVLPGSASDWVSAKKVPVKITGNGSQSIPVTVSALPSVYDDRTWDGSQLFYFHAANIQNATFADGKLSDLRKVSVTNYYNFANEITATTTSSRTIDFTDSQKYFLRNQADKIDWSATVSGTKANTAYHIKENGTWNWLVYYQYLKSGVFVNGTRQVGVEVGYTQRSDALGLSTKADKGNNKSYYQSIDGNKNNTSHTKLALAPGSSKDSSVASQSLNSQDLPAELKNAPSVTLVAEGRWDEVNSYNDYDRDTGNSYCAKTQQGNFSVTTRMTISDSANPTVTGVTFPSGEGITFPLGAKVPITVTFNEPVRPSYAELTANGKKLSAEEQSTESKTLTFLYPVETIGKLKIDVTKINDAMDGSGHTMDNDTRTWQSGNILDTITMPNAFNLTGSTTVADKAKYYPAAADQPERTTATVKVTVKLPTNTDLRGLIVKSSSSGALVNGVVAGSIDGGKNLIDLVMNSGKTEMTATLEIDAQTLMSQQNFIMEFYNLEQTDTNGNPTLFFGRYVSFSVNKPVPLEKKHLAIEKPAGWPTEAIFVNDPPEAADLTLKRKLGLTTGVTWRQTRWVSSNENIATIDANGEVHPLAPGYVQFFLKAVNGNLPEYSGSNYYSIPVSLTIKQGAAPYLLIPENELTIRSGDPVTLRWASNLVQKNAEFGKNASTTFTIRVYKGSDTDGTPLRTETVTYDPTDKSDPTLWLKDSPNQSFTLTGLTDTGTAGYTITLTAEINEKVPGVSERTVTEQAHVTVISRPVTVKLTRPSTMFQVNEGSLQVPYTLENFDAESAGGAGAEFELVVTNNSTGEAVTTIQNPDSTSGGSFTINLTDAGIRDGFRTIYDVSVKAKNTAEKDWSRDSFTLYIYDKNCLDIVVQSVGDKRVTVSGNSVTMSNEEWIKGLTQEQILKLDRDIDLQTAISINYGAHAWDEASDRIKWASKNSGVAAVNYPQGAYYENIEGLRYTSFAPATQFLLSGKNDGKTVVEAVHALVGNGLSSEVEITVETLKDKLYLFQFYPAAAGLTMTYTNGDGHTKTVPGDDQGRFAVYEARGIASDVYVKGTVNGDVYLGTVYKKDLVSQEKDAVSLELYPLNSLNLRKAATLPVYLKNPNGTNYNGTVTVHAGVYRNGVYCQEAKYTTTAGASASLDGNTPQTVTFTNGKATFYYDVTQFNTNNGANPITAADDVEFALELQAGSYYPVLFTAVGNTNEDDAIRLSERIVNLESVPPGQSNQPFVARQVAYFSGKDSGPATDMRGKNGKLGPSADYQDIVLSTTVLWWGADSGSGLDIRLKDGAGLILSGQAVSNSKYPFCSMPVSTNTVHLNQAQFDALDMGDNTTRSISLEYTRGGTTVKQEQMRWQLMNALKLSKAGESGDLKNSMDALKNIMQSEGGMSGIDSSFLTVGLTLATKAKIESDFLTMKLSPTQDPTVFRGLVWVGVSFDGDGVHGADGYGGNLLESMDPDDGTYELNYMPGLDDVKDMISSGLSAYGQTQKNMMTSAKNLLKNNVKQGGLSAVGGGEAGMEFSLSGYFETEVYYDFGAGQWKMQLVTGGFQAGGGFGYEWNFNFQVGPVPMFLDMGVGISAAVEFNAAVNNVEKVNDYLTQLQIGAYINAFGGFGFDYAIVALKLGIYGELSLGAQLRWLNAAGKSAQFGYNVGLEGEVGVKVEFELLCISYSKVLWSAGFEADLGKSGNWDSIEDYWKEVGAGKSGHVSPGSYAMRANLLASNGESGIYSMDLEASLPDRDYLSDYHRSYDSSGPRLGGATLFSMFTNSANTQIVETLENSYPMASPVLSDDGAYLFYLNDNQDKSDATNVRAAVMERNGDNGYTNGAVIDHGGYGDSGIKAAGTGSNAVAVWSRIMEKPAVTEPGQAITPDIQAGMLNSSDIMVAVRGNGGWTVKNLTEGNGVADLAPVAAANENRILVAWRQVASSSATDLTNFDTRDYIYYAVSEDYGQTWSDPQPVYNGTSGSVKGLEAAMLPSGAAAVTFSLQTGEHSARSGEYQQEIAYAIVDKDGGSYDVVRYVQMTDDANLDENPQVAAVMLDSNKEAFVFGWHCLDADSGTSDIRLAAVDQAGNRITGFVDSLSAMIQSSNTGISANFQFSRHAKTLDTLSILWSDTTSGGIDGKPAHDYLSALRFRTENDQGRARISVTAAQQIAEMKDYTTIDSFNAYVGDDGTLYAAIQGTFYDYSNLESYTVTYDSGKTGTVNIAKEKTSIYTAAGAYTDTLRVDSVIPDYANIHKGTSLPVQFGVTNLGTEPMNAVTVSIGSQETKFETGANSAFLSIAPGETRNLTAFYRVPSTGAIPNPQYTIIGAFANNSTDSKEGELVLNIPDLGIANSNILVDAVDGDRILQFNLYNLSDAELADSGRMVNFNLFSDPACTQAINPQYLTLVQSGPARNGDALLTISGADLEAVDEGSYTLQYKFDLEEYIKQAETGFADADGEVRDNGVTVYAKAWVEIPGDDGGEMQEYVSSNNVAAVTLESLLKQADGAPTTITSILSDSETGSNVSVTLQNNSMVQKATGNVVVTLLDEQGQVLEQKQTYTGEAENNGLISLNTEERKTLDTFSFNRKGASAVVTYSDVIIGADNANLVNLSFSNIPGITLASFQEVPNQSGVYQATVSTDDLTFTTVIANTESTLAKIRLADGDAGSSAISQKVELIPGDVNTITITVTNGTDTKTYILTVQNNGEPVISIDKNVETGYSASVVYNSDESATITLTTVEKPEGAGYALSYQWYSCDVSGTTLTEIPAEVTANTTSGTLTIPSTLDAGVHYYICQVTRKLLNGGEKVYKSSVASVEITKAGGNSVTVEGLIADYDGQLHQLPAATAAMPNSTVHYSTDQGSTWTTTPPSFTEVGIHTVQVKATNPNYTDTEIKTADVVIQGDPTISEPTVTITGEFGTSVVYGSDNSATIKITATQNPISAKYQLSYQWYECDVSGSQDARREMPGETRDTLMIPSTVNAGVHYYICQVTRKLLNGETKVYDSSVASVEITQAGGNSVTVKGLIADYNGHPHQLPAAAATAPNSTIQYSTNRGNTWTTTVPSFTEVGVYTVWVKATNPNYMETEVKTVDVVIQGDPTISEPTVTITGEFGTSVVYGSDNSATIKITATQNPISAKYQLSYQWYECDVSGSQDTRREMPGETRDTLMIPSTVDAGVHYYVCKVSRAMVDGSVTDYWSSVASVQITQATDNYVTLTGTTVPFDNQPHTLTSASAAKSGSTLYYSTDGETWSTQSPAFTAVGVYTVRVYARNPNYEDTAIVTADVVIQENEDTQFKLETSSIGDVFTSYPEAIKAAYADADALTAALKAEVKKLGASGNNAEVYDVKLLFSLDGGTTWTEATAENFPASGITVTLPYPTGTDRSRHNFVLQHLITNPLNTDKTAGELETIDISLTAGGICFTVDCLSPFVLGWYLRPIDESANNTDDASTPSYKVAVEKSEHGKVTSNQTNAPSGSTVTLTVTPDSGYVLDTMTVTDSRGNEIKLTAQSGGKYTFTMPSRAVTVKTTFAPLPDDVEQPCDGSEDCPSHGYTDLGTVGTWYHEAVDYVLRNGLMSGYTSTTFGPNDNLSRAQLAQILYNKEGKPAVTGGNVFTDVAEGQWYTPAITWAAANGIVNGYGNGKFGPDDNITREQLAVMLWRYAGNPAATSKELHFADADMTSAYALEALRWAVENGIINGKGGGILDPAGLATRAEAAQMLKNFIKK